MKNAFLHGDLEGEVYKDTAPGFPMPSTRGKVCWLKKVLYGLNQSPRAWFESFKAAMINNGYKQCQTYHILFVKRQGKKVTAIIVTHG